MNKYEIKRFVEDHKKELVAGAVVVGGVVLMIVGVKHRTKRIDIKVAGPQGVDIPIPDGFKRWKVDMLWSEANHIASIMEDVPIDDLGELGKQYIENGLAKSGDVATIIMGVDQK